jgi:hypothetical protein
MQDVIYITEDLYSHSDIHNIRVLYLHIYDVLSLL